MLNSICDRGRRARRELRPFVFRSTPSIVSCDIQWRNSNQCVTVAKTKVTIDLCNIWSPQAVLLAKYYSYFDASTFYIYLEFNENVYNTMKIYTFKFEVFSDSK